MITVNAEFAKKLKDAFEALDKRLTAVEHTVNETILGGLQAAADEYDEDCKFSDFVDTYSEKWKGVEGPLHVLYGEDYDVPSAMFEQVKTKEGYGTEGFDEGATLDGILEEIDAKIKGLQDLKDKVEDEKDKPDEEEIPSEEQLLEELHKAL